MKRCVLDASAAAAILFREPGAERVAVHLFAFEQVFVPQLFEIETANVARTKVLRRVLDWADARMMLSQMSEWPKQVVQVPWQSAWKLAEKHALTVYDAAYLSICVEQQLPIITLDETLGRRAGKLSLISFGR